MKIYVDSNYRCHTSNPDGVYTEIEADFFNDKCDEFVEGYCYDESRGYPAIYPWKNLNELENAQREYEQQLLKELQENSIPVADLENAYREGVNSVYD